MRRVVAVVSLVVMTLVGCRDHRDPPAPTRAPPARYQPPTPVPAPIAAIGDTTALPADVQRALDPSVDYAPRPPVVDGDWLAEQNEPGQTFAQYERSAANRPDSYRHVLYLLPLGDLPAERAPPIDDLVAVMQAFFAMQVRVLPKARLEDIGATRRINTATGQPQVLAPDVLRWLALHVPTDAYAVMAVTMIDLYPDPTWNFVYGQATFTERVGVQSFARYDPAFFDEPRPDGWRRTLTRRAAQVLVHEVTHMFGVEHCVHWACVAAGANHQREFDSHPLHLCPVCLRKLWSAIGFDVGGREAALAAVWARLGLNDEATWSARRAARIIDGHLPPSPD